ncbi:DNA polymerase III subunit alpha [Bacillaceae bacterium W0354]
MSFIHLDVHSSYTLLESTIKIDEYVSFAKQKGIQTIALSDHEVLNGVYQFINQCQKNDLKPLVGMSLDVYIDSEKRPCRFILFAKNFEGYQSLVSFSNNVQLHNKKVSLNEIVQCENLIPIVSFYGTFIEELLYLGDSNLVFKIFDTLENHFDDWFINIDPITSSSQIIHEWLLKQDRSLLKKTVITTRVRFLKHQERIGYESLIAMKNGTTYDQIKRQSLQATHFLDEKEMIENIDIVWHESLKRTNEIANLCDLNFPDKLFDLPHYPIENGMSSEEYLTELCFKQLEKRYDATLINEAKTRLKHELEIIKGMRFSDYFLIVWDIVQFAKKNNILVGPGRGSAAGSIVAYLLGIIEVDPIKYHLLFERFLNPERQSMPDIDIDFSDYRRDEVIKYVANKYGVNFVAQIITFGTFQARSTIRELSKVFQIEKEQTNYLLKQLSQQTESLKAAVKDNKDIQSYVKQSPKLVELFKAAFVIEGLPRHYSTHAAGVVISDESLLSKIPVTTGQDHVMLTQWSMKDLESVGLLKMDFLGLRNLTFLERMVKQIEEKENIKIDLIKLPLNDSKTFQLLQRGFTSGVFQLESDGMKKALMAIQPTHLEDIVAVNALFRPGPMQFIETFARRKKGLEKTVYIHEDIKSILESTYGVLVYQEQIMQIANKLAGFTFGQADLLRRAISKKDSHSFHELKEKFIQGCQEKGYEPSLSEEIFRWIEKFANYGFNKSHAVAYSLISYQTAYFKANYPAYFYAELMSQHMHDQSKLERYIKEAKSLGINVLPPSINKSFGKFIVESDKSIRFGLLAIKGLGKQAYDEIVNARKNKPYKHLFDFCKRIPLNAVNQSIIEALIMAGAFDETNHHRAQLLASVMPAIEQGELFSGLDEQVNLHDDFNFEVAYHEVEPFSATKQLSMEKEVIGFVISEHPLVKVRRALQKQGLSSIKDLIKKQTKRTEPIVCIVEQIKNVRTKRGEQMAFLTIQDETLEIDAVVFPSVHRQVNRWLEEEIFVKIEGRVDEREGKRQIIINSMEPFVIDQLPKTTDEKIYIKMQENEEEEQLNTLKLLSQQFPGQTPVVVFLPSKKKSYQLRADYDLDISETIINKLKEIFGLNHVVIKK